MTKEDKKVLTDLLLPIVNGVVSSPAIPKEYQLKVLEAWGLWCEYDVTYYRLKDSNKAGRGKE